MRNPLTFHHLKGIIHSHSHDIVFIIETKNKEAFVRRKMNNCGSCDFCIVNPIGRAGGLALAWKDGTAISIVNVGEFFIHACIFIPSVNSNMDMVFVYFSSVDETRNAQFNFLSNYKMNFDANLVFIGDFNSTMRSWEKEGGNHISNASYLPFRNFINDWL